MAIQTVVRVTYNWYWNRRGWSPGKRAWGLRVEGADGARPTLMRALVRALAGEVSTVFYLGYVWASWDRQGQTWHDKAAASWVVRDRPAEQADGGAPPNP
ncbi:MAG: RDD family protein [Chloroflexi bacterium]|nr:RDD family protein [Chloroflexota bacterium]